MREKSLAARLTGRFRGNPLLSKTLAQTGSALRDKQWIFVLGCYNSGTTLLDQIISRHPEVSGLSDEGVMLTDKLPRPEDFGWRRMWHRCEEKMKIGGDEKSVADTVKRHWSHFYNKNRAFLVEKSISNTPRSLFFQRNFQPAYFIHIVRNGYAVAEGIRRKAAVMDGNPFQDHGAYPIEECAMQWKRSIEVVNFHRSELKNFMEITYESLTDNPEDTVKSICLFLGITYHESLTASSFSVHENEDKILNMNNRSIKMLRPSDVSTINSVASDALKFYGYYTEC